MSESSGLRSVIEVDEAMHPGVDLAAGPCRAKMTSTPRPFYKKVAQISSHPSRPTGANDILDDSCTSIPRTLTPTRYVCR